MSKRKHSIVPIDQAAQIRALLEKRGEMRAPEVSTTTGITTKRIRLLSDLGYLKDVGVTLTEPGLRLQVVQG